MKKTVLFLLAVLFFCGCNPVEDEIKILPEGYEGLFTHGLIHDIEIQISQAEWDGLIQDLKDYIKTGNYRSATFIYSGPAGEATIEEVGFRVKGNLSRVIPEDDSGTFHRAHFKVRFNHEFDLVEGTQEYEQREERRFCRLRALNIRMPAWGSGSWDVTQIREMFSYDLFNRAGCYTSKTGSARLFITINGVKRYFGVYNLEEPIDKSFLSKRYSKDGNDGNLYKCIHGDSGPASLEPVDGVDGPGNATEIYPERKIMGSKDWTQAYRPTYDLKTNEAEADHTGLLDFIYNLNALDSQGLRAYLDENFEMGRFLKFLAMNFLINRWDDYTTIGNNYYLYFHNDGKIEFMTVDHDSALGAVPGFYGIGAGIYDWRNQSNELVSYLSGIPLWYLNNVRDYQAPLTDKIFQIPDYRTLYETYLAAFITPANKLFLYSEFEKKYNQQRALYLPHLNNDINEGEYMTNPVSVRNFFYEKTQAVVNQLGLDEDDYETGP